VKIILYSFVIFVVLLIPLSGVSPETKPWLEIAHEGFSNYEKLSLSSENELFQIESIILGGPNFIQSEDGIIRNENHILEFEWLVVAPAGKCSVGIPEGLNFNGADLDRWCFLCEVIGVEDCGLSRPDDSILIFSPRQVSDYLTDKNISVEEAGSVDSVWKMITEVIE